MGFLKSIQKAVSKPANVVAAVVKKVVPPAVVNVVASVAKQTTANVTTLGSAVNTEVHKPSLIAGLQATTKIALGVTELGLSVVPGGSLANKAINTSLAAGNGKSGGQVGAWTGIGDTNSTLNMVPGGLLAQNIAGVATNGKSNQEMNRFVPDPKKMVIGAVTHPSSTLAVAKTVTQQNVQTGKVSLTSVFHAAATSAPASTLHAVVNKTPLPKPSMFAGMSSIPAMQRPNTITASTDSLPEPSMPADNFSTLTKTEDKPLVTIQPVEDKPSIVDALVTATVSATPPPPPTSTLTANTQRAISTPTTTLDAVGPPSFFSFCTVM